MGATCLIIILPKKLTNDSECPEDLRLTSGKVCEVCNAFCSPVLLQGVNKTRYEAVQCLQRTGLKAHLCNEFRDKPRRMQECEQDVRQPWCNWQVKLQVSEHRGQDVLLSILCTQAQPWCKATARLGEDRDRLHYCTSYVQPYSVLKHLLLPLWPEGHMKD